MSEQPHYTEAVCLVSQHPEKSESKLGLQHHQPEVVNIEPSTTVETPILSTSSNNASGEKFTNPRNFLLTLFHQIKCKLTIILQHAKDSLELEKVWQVRTLLNG